MSEITYSELFILVCLLSACFAMVIYLFKVVCADEVGKYGRNLIKLIVVSNGATLIIYLLLKIGIYLLYSGLVGFLIILTIGQICVFVAIAKEDLKNFFGDGAKEEVFSFIKHSIVLTVVCALCVSQNASLHFFGIASNLLALILFISFNILILEFEHKRSFNTELKANPVFEQQNEKFVEETKQYQAVKDTRPVKPMRPLIIYPYDFYEKRLSSVIEEEDSYDDYDNLYDSVSTNTVSSYPCTSSGDEIVSLHTVDKLSSVGTHGANPQRPSRRKKIRTSLDNCVDTNCVEIVSPLLHSPVDRARSSSGYGSDDAGSHPDQSFNTDNNISYAEIYMNGADVEKKTCDRTQVGTSNIFDENFYSFGVKSTFDYHPKEIIKESVDNDTNVDVKIFATRPQSTYAITIPVIHNVT